MAISEDIYHTSLLYTSTLQMFVSQFFFLFYIAIYNNSV